MRRGEIWLADLEPVRGSVANKVRPVVLISNDGANQRAQQYGRGIVTVLPVTSNVEYALPFQVRLEPSESGLEQTSKVQAEQVRALDTTRLVRRIGRVEPARMWEVDEALRVHLAL